MADEAQGGRKRLRVRFAEENEGEVRRPRGEGRSDDEEDFGLAAAEEGEELVADERSLGVEDPAIEPFHMAEERRKERLGTAPGDDDADAEDEALERLPDEAAEDAWLEDVDLRGTDQGWKSRWEARKLEQSTKEAVQKGPVDVKALRTLLGRSLLPAETPTRAIARVGAKLREARSSKDKEAVNTGLAELNQITEWTDTLMGAGMPNVYWMPRESLLPPVLWLLRWTTDGEVHGPVSSSQMDEWEGAGYFAPYPDAAVQVSAKSDSPWLNVALLPWRSDEF